MRTSKKTQRGPINTNQQQSNTFKVSLRAWQARYKEQRATQSPGMTANNSAAR